MIEAKEMQRKNEPAASKPRPQTNPPASKRALGEEFAPLFEGSHAEQFRARWLDIQSRFVDDPSNSVKEADELVGSMIKNITGTFARARTSLEGQWKNGEQVSTEELRLALKRYRAFFNKLLSIES